MSAVNTIIADDHPLFRSALRQAAATSVPEEYIKETSDIEGLFTLLSAHPEIELVFLDLTIPGANGLQALSQLRNQYPDILIIMVSANETPSIIKQAMTLGASGYIPKSSSLDIISQAIAHVLNGDNWLPPDIDLNDVQVNDEQSEFSSNLEKLTPQQYRVLAMIAEGLLNKQIAFEMSIQETTIKQHVSAILRKLNVYNRTQAGILFDQLSQVGKTE
ncbi:MULTISPECIES: response regulator transcription factor [Pseudoalteromonas]|jgi:DNA-binding NarL/FixJ family response regulator|uniref:response regulator transcription factor n=1 Tax=Pseudoalteromonas TaxID=53246 RepID=UPI0003F7C2DC|nr:MULTISPECIES: response regulator transcription factor [Pseudoalteromonas]MBB1278035.1 response regulator transcription factor [Pseudoalteromonas sp. SR43-3]TVU72449.1 response regulator transcription factor [Pseudoalteromonas elyakovii]|tara:strand:+ start:7659 stop:8312 length:654 start_codon:yes stop_codon:yes gene_type:complete